MHCNLELNHKYIINTFPEVPSHLIQEITSNIMPHYIFYKKNKSKAECYCTNCKTRYELDYYSNEVAHNRATVCEKCAKTVFFKSDGMGRTSLVNQEKVSILLPNSYSGVYIRNFTVVQKLEDYETFEPKFKETQRYYISNSGSLMWDEAYQYHNNQEPPHWNFRKSIYTPSIFWNGYDGKDVIQINYQSLKETAYKYINMDNNVALKDPIKYIAAFAQFPCIEYLTKAGFNQLASGIIDSGSVGRYLNPHATNLKDFFNVTKQECNQFITMPEAINKAFIGTYHKVKKIDPKITVEDILYIQRHKSYFKEITKLTQVPLIKILKYLKKQNHTPYYYRDYVSSCDKLNYDWKNERILFPKNLEVSHDYVVNLVKHQSDKLLDEKTEKRSKKLNKYEHTSGDFAIIIPKTASSIIDEGAKLNHCVGGYAHRHADGEVIILFLRKTNNIDTPFYTIEINPSNQSIVQCKGFKNKSTTQEIEDFLKKWQNFMHNKNQRIRQGVA